MLNLKINNSCDRITYRQQSVLGKTITIFRNFEINVFVKPYTATNYGLFQYQFCSMFQWISISQFLWCLVNIANLRKRTWIINIIKYSLSKQSAHIELAQQDIKTYWTKNSSKQAACTPWFIIKCQGFIGKRIHAIFSNAVTFQKLVAKCRTFIQHFFSRSNQWYVSYYFQNI